MSSLSLRVELPSYSHSFTITIPKAANIADVKRIIFDVCEGGPKIEGQKLIWRGRFLADEETAGNIWESEGANTVHLAVHPTAWSTTPPEIRPSLPTPVQLPAFSGSSVSNAPVGPTPPLIRVPVLAYVIAKHQDALSVLTDGKLSENSGIYRESFYRTWSIQAVERNGYTWPDILDEDFPTPSEDMSSGVKYERINLEGRSYLTLRTPLATPNILQIHALKVLTYTYPIMFLPMNHASISTLPPPSHIPANINQHLQQLGLASIRVTQQANQPPQNQNAVRNAPNLIPDLQGIDFRPLLAPFVTLIVRILLLVYFVSPARKPIFGLIMLAWLLYELGWGHIREALMDGLRRRRPRNAANARQEAAPAEQEQPGQGQGQAQAQPRQPAGARPDDRAPQRDRPQGPQQAEAILNHLASINLALENDALKAREGALLQEEPSLGQKTLTFVSLLIVTLHPAIWNRRRAALRKREGRLRMEANEREREPEMEATGAPSDDLRAQARVVLIEQHERRPGWAKRYVERVREEEWIEE